jgi:hypothetical protein
MDSSFKLGTFVTIRKQMIFCICVCVLFSKVLSLEDVHV